MIIKTFRADTSAAALKRVREEMGGDAVVLKTMQVESGGGRALFEVTACLENPTVAQTNMIFPDSKSEKSAPAAVMTEVAEEASVVYEEEKKETPVVGKPPEISIDWESRFKNLDAKLSQILLKDVDTVVPRFAPFEFVDERFRQHDVDTDFALEFLAELLEEYKNTEDVKRYAEQRLVATISPVMSPDFKLNIGDRVAFIGSAGAGKSSVMGKMATQLVVHEKKKVNLISLDDVKMGATDETAAYAEILGASYADTRTAFDGATLDESSVSLIDTVALPDIKADLTPLKDRLDAIETTYRIAVVSATERSSDIKQTITQLKELGATHLVITKLDLSKCLGSMITAVYQLGIQIVYLTGNQGGVGELHTPDPAKIARSIMQTEETDA